jgi:hypothetical protein
MTNKTAIVRPTTAPLRAIFSTVAPSYVDSTILYIFSIVQSTEVVNTYKVFTWSRSTRRTGEGFGRVVLAKVTGWAGTAKVARIVRSSTRQWLLMVDVVGLVKNFVTIVAAVILSVKNKFDIKPCVSTFGIFDFRASVALVSCS